MTKTNDKPKKKDPGVRMLDEREETLDVRLTQVEMDELHNQHLVLTNQRDDLEERLAELKANYKAQFEAIDLQVSSTRKLLNTKRRQVPVKVQTWLTKSNEVIRVRTDNGDQLGDPRKARADELQESLFPDKPADEAQGDAGQQDGEGEGQMFEGDGATG